MGWLDKYSQDISKAQAGERIKLDTVNVDGLSNATKLQKYRDSLTAYNIPFELTKAHNKSKGNFLKKVGHLVDGYENNTLTEEEWKVWNKAIMEDDEDTSIHDVYDKYEDNEESTLWNYKGMTPIKSGHIDGYLDTPYYKKPMIPNITHIQGETSPLQKIETKTDNTLQPRRKTPVKIDSYDVTQIHDKHSTRGRFTTPEKTEELYDEYQRFKDIKGGPKLKVKANYQDGGNIPKAQAGERIKLDEVEIKGYSKDKQTLYDRYVKDNHPDSDATHGINFLRNRYVTPDRNYMKEGYEKDLVMYNDSLKLWKTGEEEKRKYFELLEKNNLSADKVWNYSKEQGMSRSARIQPINYNRVLQAQNPENMWGQRGAENYYRTITKEEGVDEDENTYRYSIDGKIKNIPWDSKTAFELSQGYHTFKKPTKPIPSKPRKKVEDIKIELGKVSSIKQKEEIKLQPRRKTPVKIDSYDVTQVHDKHSTRGRFTTPEKTEELYDDYQRYKDLPNGPKLKVTPNYQDGGWLDKYQDGGDTHKIDSILGANKHLPWVKRLYDKDGPNIQLPGVDGTSTHYMSQIDNYALPLVDELDGKLQYIEKPSIKRRDSLGIKFKSPEEALWFTENYKKGTGVLPKAQNEGELIEKQKDNTNVVTRDQKVMPYKINPKALEKFDPEGSGYDYETAIKYGMQPKEGEHWDSRVPETGQILKGRKHPTYNKAIRADLDLGYRVYRGEDGKYYSEDYGEVQNKIAHDKSSEQAKKETDKEWVEQSMMDVQDHPLWQASAYLTPYALEEIAISKALPYISKGYKTLKSLRNTPIPNKSFSNIEKAMDNLSENPFSFRKVGNADEVKNIKELNPDNLDFNSGFKKYQEAIASEENIIMRQHANGELTFEEYMAASDDIIKSFNKFTPFGEKLGQGSFNSVYEFAGNPEYALRYGRPQHPITENFLSVAKELRDKGTSVPLKANTFGVKVDGPSANYWPDTDFEVSMVDNLNKVKTDPINLSERDVYANLFRRIRKLRDKGIVVDAENLENFKFNPNKGIVDIFDLEPQPTGPYYQTYIKERLKNKISIPPKKKNGGWMDKYQDGGNISMAQDKGELIEKQKDNTNVITRDQKVMPYKINPNNLEEQRAIQGNEEAFAKSSEQATKEIAKDWVEQSMMDVQDHPLWQAPAYLSPYAIEDVLLSKAAPYISKALPFASKNFNSIKSNAKNFFREVLGEIKQGKQNRAAIKEGTEWLDNWISHPTTQSKLDAMYANPNKYHDKPQDLFGLNQHLAQVIELPAIKTHRPIISEYPLSNQLEDLIFDGSNIHSGNFGVSYTGNSSYQPFAYLGGTPSRKIRNPYDGNWISRIKHMDQESRASTTVHEGVHDWFKDSALENTGTRKMIEEMLSPQQIVDLREWQQIRMFPGLEPMDAKRASKAYMTNPTEIHARIMEVRKHFDLNPDDFIDNKRAAEMFNNLSDSFKEAIGNSPANLKKLLNKLAGVAAPIGTGTVLANKGEGSYKNGGWLDNFQEGGVIKDNRGQWDHPGEITEIDSNQITMKGVHYPVLGISDTGDKQMMYPNKDYKFKGNKVTEYPMAQDGGWLDKAQAGVTKMVHGEDWTREEREKRLPPEQPEVYITDRRKVRATTGKKIRPTKDLISGYYDFNALDNFVNYAKEKGLSQEDIWNLITIDMQETGWGNRSEGTIGHVLGEFGGKNMDENFVEAYIHKMAEADRLGITDPIKRLQIYNGTGIIRPGTEKKFHGYEMDSIYGVPIPKEGIDMKENPLYGKQIMDLKENILKKDSDVMRYMDSTFNAAPTPKRLPLYDEKHEINAWEDADKEEFFESLNEKVLDKKQDGGWLDKMQDGGTVRELWEKTTGTNWAQAKERGLTDSSYESNIKLRGDLEAGMYDREPAQTIPDTPQYGPINDEQGTYKEAFASARKSLGPNKIFKYQGKTYGTNLKGEDFNPSDSELKKFKIDTAEVKERLKVRRAEINSPYVVSEKAPTNLTPQWQNWEDIKEHDAELNKVDNAEMIRKYHDRGTVESSYKIKSGDNLSTIAKNNGMSLAELKKINNLKGDVIHPEQELKIYKASKNSKQYLIVDKKTGKAHLYRGGKEIVSIDILVGENAGDAQTVTKVKDPSDDGIPITSEEASVAKADWEAGNKTTGAGEYTVSTIQPKSKLYANMPLFNLKNDSGTEVATTIHALPSRRSKYGTSGFKASNGCINGKCEDMTDLLDTYGLTTGDKVYILPEDEGNSFRLRNNKLVFDSNSGKNYNEYVDSRGKKQKGQGVNRTVNSLKYNPIKIEFDEEAFKKDKFTWSDTNDTEELEGRTKPFIAALSKDKQSLMKDIQIDGDVYNEIAKTIFGVYGVESNFGDDNSDFTNTLKAGVRIIGDRTGLYRPTGAPDSGFESDMRHTYKPKSKNASSMGLTQVVWDQITNTEKKLLKKYGITKIGDFQNAKKAAIGSIIILGNRYNNEIKGKKDPNKLAESLAYSWNHGKGYYARIKRAQRFINLKELR